MKTLLLAVALCSCGGPDKAEPIAHGSPVAAEATVEDVSLRWAKAALGGNKAEAIALSLTHAQLGELSTKEVDKAEFDELLNGFIDGLAREGKENPDGKVVGAKVSERKTLPAGEKRKRSIEYAAIRLVIEEKGEQREAGPPLLFIKTDAGWRFSPKQ